MIIKYHCAMKSTFPEGAWLFAANFSDEELRHGEFTLPAGEFVLKKL